MRWAHCQSQAKARVLAHSIVLDFGTGPATAGSPITRTFATGPIPPPSPPGTANSSERLTGQRPVTEPRAVMV
jgi:hypothetical protein